MSARAWRRRKPSTFRYRPVEVTPDDQVESALRRRDRRAARRRRKAARS